MSALLKNIEEEFSFNPDLLDGCFDGGFNQTSLLTNLKRLGFLLDDEDLKTINKEISANGNTKFSLLLPKADTGEIIELSAGEVNIVAGGFSEAELDFEELAKKKKNPPVAVAVNAVVAANVGVVVNITANAYIVVGAVAVAAVAVLVVVAVFGATENDGF